MPQYLICRSVYGQVHAVVFRLDMVYYLFTFATHYLTEWHTDQYKLYLFLNGLFLVSFNFECKIVIFQFWLTQQLYFTELNYNQTTTKLQSNYNQTTTILQLNYN